MKLTRLISSSLATSLKLSLHRNSLIRCRWPPCDRKYSDNTSDLSSSVYWFFPSRLRHVTPRNQSGYWQVEVGRLLKASKKNTRCYQYFRQHFYISTEVCMRQDQTRHSDWPVSSWAVKKRDRERQGEKNKGRGKGGRKVGREEEREKEKEREERERERKRRRKWEGERGKVWR